MSDANSSPHVVDAGVWVGCLLETDFHHPASVRWLDDRLRAGGDVVIPALALVEISGAISRRRTSAEAGTEAVAWVEQLPNLIVIDLDRTLIHAAAHLAATLRLRGADAIYVALAQRLSLPLITWDSELLDRAAHVIAARTPPAD